jgi:O-antigen/teichoic acid export membrane protein
LQAQAQVAKGATSLYIANIVVLLANSLYFIALTNILRSTLEVGVMTALNIMIWLLVTVCILAQPITLQSPVPAPLAVLKFLPELFAKRAQAGAARVFEASLLSALAISGVIAALLSALTGLVIPLLGGQAVLPVYVQLSAVDVVVVSLGQICIGALIALGDMKEATAYLVGWSIVRYGLASALLVPYGINGVLIGFIVGDALLVPVAFRKSRQGLRGDTGAALFSLADLTRYSLYTLISALLGFAVNQADRLFTLAQQGLPELAIYNVAIVASSFTGFAPYALLTVLLPALAALHASSKRVEMRDMIRSYTRYVSLAVMPVAFGFASVAIVALRIFGPEYTNGLWPTIIVSIATGVTAIGSVYAGGLLAVGELRWYTAANVLGLLALLGISAVATPILGLNGPALGRAGLLTIAALVYGFAMWRRGYLELDSKAFVIATGASAVMAVVVFELVFLVHTFLIRLLMLPVFVAVGALIYVLCLRVLRLLTPEDIDFLRGILPARFHKWLPKVARLAGISQ